MKRFPVILSMAIVFSGISWSPGGGQSRNEVLQKAGLPAEARAAILTVGDDVKKLDRSHEAFVKAAGELDGLYARLVSKVREVSGLAAEAEKDSAGRLTALLEAIEGLTEMTQSFNIRHLDLQKQMQDENRRYTLVSNIMKTKHDTAKAAINNVR
jgi:hypothetical protein